MKISNAISKFSIQLLAITNLLTIPFGAQAAIDMFLQLEGVDGESKDVEFQDWIEVLAFTEGLTQSGTTHTGGGGGTGKVSVQDISITKYLDTSSPFIRQKLAEGRIIRKATLVVRKAGENPLVIFRIEMTDVLLTSVSAGASGVEDRLTENVTLNFAQVTWEYTPQKEDGSGDASIIVGWDIVENTPL